MVQFYLSLMPLRTRERVTSVSLPAEQALLEMRSATKHRYVDHARWFISLRWIAVLVAATLSVLAVHFLELLPETVWLPLVLTIATLAALNLFYMVRLRSEQGIGTLIAFQAYADLVLLTILIHFSGGIENPLVLLMIFHVIIAGITLSRKQCYTVAVAATALFALLAWAEASNLVDHYTLKLVPHHEEHGQTAHAAHDPLYVTSFAGLQGTILLLTAFFVTTLSERLRQKEQQLETLARRALTQRQLLEQSLETTGTGLYVCDTDLQPILTNRRWESWFAQVDTVLHEKIFGEQAPLRKTLADGKVRVRELTVADEAKPSPVKDTPTFQTMTAPLRDTENRITYVVQLVQDITKQKTAQAQMIRAGQLAAVGELAGQVAHEVNNPIAIISAKARLLVSDHPEEMSEHTARELQKIIQLSDRVARIAQGLLSYCRPSVATRVQLDIGLPLRHALAMIEQHASHAGIETEIHLPDQLPPVYANAQEIEQVFLNLFLNAIDAMPEGGRLTVEAQTDQEQRHNSPSTLQVVVKDNGMGISEEVQHRIFEPFFTTKPEGKGTGLGLSICHGLIQNYGGSIDVDSTVGQGTRITVHLPVHQPKTEASYG